MAIVTQAEPAGGRSILHAALRKRFHKRHNIPALRGSAQTGKPLPVYHLSHRGAAHSKPLSQAKKIGWRYPVIGGKSLCLATLLEERDGLKYVGICEGLLPKNLFDAAFLAEKDLKHLKWKFQPRLLEIPSLHIFVLWLYAPRGRSRFVSLSHEPTPSAPELQIENDVQPRIIAALAAARPRRPARRVGSPPSN